MPLIFESAKCTVSAKEISFNPDCGVSRAALGGCISGMNTIEINDTIKCIGNNVSINVERASNLPDTIIDSRSQLVFTCSGQDGLPLVGNFFIEEGGDLTLNSTCGVNTNIEYEGQGYKLKTNQTHIYDLPTLITISEGAVSGIDSDVLSSTLAYIDTNSDLITDFISSNNPEMTPSEIQSFIEGQYQYLKQAGPNALEFMSTDLVDIIFGHLDCDSPNNSSIQHCLNSVGLFDTDITDSILGYVSSNNVDQVENTPAVMGNDTQENDCDTL